MRPKTLVPVLVLFACLVSVSDVHALANRVFVSARSGNDANSCDNILTPCQTFQGAVNQVAAGGEVIVLDSGGYGKVSISKSVKIEAPPGVVAFIHPASGDAVSIVAGPTDVVILRGLVLNVGPLSGISVGNVGELHVENCVIDGFNQGITFVSSGQLVVLDTIVRHCDTGINVRAQSGTTVAGIERCRLDNNVNGLAVAAFNPGVAKASIKDSFAWGNLAVGMRADASSGGTAELNVENCLSANNDIGISGFPGTGTTVVRVSNTTVTDNTGSGVATTGAQILTRGNNTVEGNSPNGTFTGTFMAK